MESTLRTVSAYARLTGAFAGADEITLWLCPAPAGEGITQAATPPAAANNVAEAASQARALFDGFTIFVVSFINSFPPGSKE